jgi:hypothetical protein
MPAEPSAAQSEASRRNALRSTGPATVEGKAASSRNAVRHGLRGAIIEVLPEEQGWLAELLASLAGRWQPADAVEQGLVQSLALLELKLVRLDTVELQALAAGPDADGPRLPSLSTLVRYRSRLLKERWEAEHRLRTAIAQRCTNEAEARTKALASSRDRMALDERCHRQERAAEAILAAAAERQVPPLNREQRRRLAAVQRRAA